MQENVRITNQTMELADCKAAWSYNENWHCWCLEDILYTDKAAAPEFQRLSIFVPAPYLKEAGEIDGEGTVNGYTPATVPVIFENNSAGYMQMPHVRLGEPRCYAYPYLEQGYVYVTCGNRGRESRDAEGRLCGKAPANLVDLKTAIRFLRHNKGSIPGNMDRIISVGWSAGGAMSALLAVTGDHASFLPYLRENGAFLEESDAVYAAQIYCPIIDLEHADLAYEWTFAADRENEASHVGPAGTMTPFQEALSAKLQKKYIPYFNAMHLQDPESGEVLQIGEDGRSGSGYAYLMRKLSDSATVYLRKLRDGKLPVCYGLEEYLAGDYTYRTLAMGGPPSPDSPGPAMVERKGDAKEKWLNWNGEAAEIRDLDTYVLCYRRRMKPCPSFDILSGESGENQVLGTPERPALHFNPDIADAIEELKEEFPQEYERYYPGYAAAAVDQELQKRVRQFNPLRYIGTGETCRQAEYYRIRVGAADADTAFTVSMTLALKLHAEGKQVDYQLVWDQPHSEADYPGEVIEWIQSIV